MLNGRILDASIPGPHFILTSSLFSRITYTYDAVQDCERWVVNSEIAAPKRDIAYRTFTFLHSQFPISAEDRVSRFRAEYQQSRRRPARSEMNGLCLKAVVACDRQVKGVPASDDEKPS